MFQSQMTDVKENNVETECSRCGETGFLLDEIIFKKIRLSQKEIEFIFKNYSGDEQEICVLCMYYAN